MAWKRMKMSPEIRQEYIELFDTCIVRPDRKGIVEEFINKLMRGTSHYDEVQAATKVPWYVVGLIHGMESYFDFGTHLHNGDSLSRRTWNEPKGRPPASVGDPPFSWVISAIDALQYDRLTAWDDWSVAGICYKMEAYNGWGYRNHQINSPYLWSMSNHYTKGKYTVDGHFNPDVISDQVGAITALKKMTDDKLVALSAQKVVDAEA